MYKQIALGFSRLFWKIENKFNKFKNDWCYSLLKTNSDSEQILLSSFKRQDIILKIYALNWTFCIFFYFLIENFWSGSVIYLNRI